MKVGVAIGGTIGEVAVLAARAEAAGLESVWLAELDRTALVQAAAAISATSRIGVGTAVALACRERPWRSPLDPAQVQLKALLPSEAVRYNAAARRLGSVDPGARQ